MTINLDQAAVKIFESEVISEFQETGSDLRSSVRMKDAKNASSVQFPVFGQMMANERTSLQTPLPTQDPSITTPVATVKNYSASTYVDIFLNNQTNFDARQEAAKEVAFALNRRIDQIILDALATTTTTAIPSNVSGTADNLNVAMFAKAAETMGSKVPDVDRHIVCHDKGFYHFIQEGDVKTIDSNLRKPLADGKLPNYLGFDIHKMGDRDAVIVGDAAGGLPLSGSNRTSYFWQKQAVGLAINMQPRIEVNYVPSYGAHLVTGYVSAGAVIVQNDGVIPLTTSEA